MAKNFSAPLRDRMIGPDGVVTRTWQPWFEAKDEDVKTVTTIIKTVRTGYVDAASYGTAYNSTTINAAITAIGSAQSALLLAPGSWIMNDDITVPANVSLEFTDGAIITTTGYTLAVSGPITAGRYKIFTGTGTVTCTGTVYPEWWGAVGDDSTSCSTAINAATASGAKKVEFSDGTYRIDAKITTADGSAVCLAGNGYGSQLKKMYNGAMISLGKLCEMRNLYLNGNGATYTGVGVEITTGALDNVSWRRIHNCDILSTASYGVEFSGDRAGYSSSISVCRIVPTGTTAAIKFPTLGSTENNGNRSLTDVWTYGNPIVDLGDSNNTVMASCDGFFPIFSQYTTKVAIAGSRLNVLAATAATINGTAHAIAGNTINAAGALGVVFAATLLNTKFQGNAIGSGIPVTDSAPGFSVGNDIYFQGATYVPTWTGSVTNPVLNDGTLAGHWERRGQFCRVNIKMTAGAGTTFGSGYWDFSIPYAAARFTTGSALLYDSSGATYTYVGTAITDAATQTIRVGIDAGAAYVGATVPFSWASGDYLVVDMEYLIA